jgi:hypothetical protein
LQRLQLAFRMTSQKLSISSISAQLPNSRAPSWRLRVSGKCPRATSPTPRLTCARYEFYYDIVLDGQYTFKIIRMHEEYGPIVRINPYELHVATPKFYQKLYTGLGKRRHRWHWYTSSSANLNQLLRHATMINTAFAERPSIHSSLKVLSGSYSPSLTNELTHC